MMEFLNYRLIKAKLKKRSLLFKKPSLEDASSQFYSLARQLEDHKSYSGFCHLAITDCRSRNSAQVGSLLNAARAFSNAKSEIISPDDHLRTVIWIYTEALRICDRSFIGPIRLEMGRFYESLNMYVQAADCFKHSMSISRCVFNLIMAKRYMSALDELKNCPSHLMTAKDHTSMFLLELLLNHDSEELSRNSLQHLLTNSRTMTNRGLLAIDDQLHDLTSLLESLLIIVQEKNNPTSENECLNQKIEKLVVDKLSAFLDPAQVQILYVITKMGQ